MDIRIDAARLRADLEELGRIGRDARGGISRPSFSPADFEARAWLRARIESAGLAYRQDGAGNQFGRLGAPGRVVMAGSHIDTIVEGGMFDGAAGVLAALECLRRIAEERVQTRLPLEVASFTDEEGNLVGDFLGSRAFLGVLEEERLRSDKTTFGLTLPEILENREFSVESILSAHRDRPELEAYLELHIEQGVVLDTEEIPIGIVEAIAGKQDRLCSFIGLASHAGTTPMELRQDAFLGLADFALRATRHTAGRHYGSMVTIGRAALHPGAFSVIAGQADFTLDFRSASTETLGDLERELLAIAEEVAAARGLRFASRLVDETPPVRIPERLTSLLEAESERLGHPRLRLTSGAGHDAQVLAASCDAGMIFIPSPDGLSHSPRESIRWEDLEKGANLLLAALLRLAA